MIGFKIYYEKGTGNEILTIPEQHHQNTVPATKEQDFAMYPVLQARNPEQVDFVQLYYGQHRGDFEKSTSWKVDLETREVLFQHPNFEPNHSNQIAQLKAENEQLNSDIGLVLFESAMDKAKIAGLEASQGDLLMEIAILKMGGNF